MYLSNICVAAAATPRATVAANSGVDIDPGAVGALALGLGLREPYSDHPFPLPYQCLCECSGVIPEFDLGSFALNMLPVGGSNDARHWPV